MSIVDLVYHYRTLQGRCELGVGLEIEEIAALTELEAELVLDPRDQAAADGRKTRREPVVLNALLRGPGLNDRVAVHDFGPGGLAASGVPFADEGDTIEVVIDAGDVSYRFKARVEWVRDDGDDYEVGMSFVGLPVRLHYGPASEPLPESALDRIAA
jgi:hypothetical protein